MAGIYTGAGGPLTEIVRWSPTFGGFGSYAMNSGGTVVFVADRNLLVYTGDGGAPVLRINGAPTSTSYNSVAINDAGTVVAIGGSVLRPSHLVVAAGGATRTPYEGGTAAFAALGPGAAINNPGAIAFHGRRPVAGAEPVDGIYLGDGSVGGTPHLVADTDGPFAQVFSPDVNNAGEVAFVGRLDADADGQAFGIYTGPDPVADRVIKVGDELFGRTVVRLGFRDGLNDLGQLVFSYELAGGLEGVAVATPVPEPAGAALVAAAASASLLRRRRVTPAAP